MAKKQGRKPQKRPRVEHALDDELIELSTLLYEHKLDSNAAGWLSIPWRNGWNAVSLAHDVAHDNEDGCPTGDECLGVLAPLGAWIRHKDLSTTSYQDAGDILERGSMHKVMRAAYRCYQVLVARSDAGGEAYNELMRPAFEALEPANIADQILYWRRRDVLGHVFDERRMRAFDIAWRRGLYRAAYAL